VTLTGWRKWTVIVLATIGAVTVTGLVLFDLMMRGDLDWL